jgi:hypothetical protein
MAHADALKGAARRGQRLLGAIEVAMGPVRISSSVELRSRNRGGDGFNGTIPAKSTIKKSLLGKKKSRSPILTYP